MKQPVERRLAAILAADVAGFNSLIDADLDGTLRALKAIRRDLVDPTIEAHNGRLLKTSGDLLLVEFSNVVEALRCATDLQRTVAEHNRNLPAGKRIEFRIGVHQGDVVIQDGYLFGDGVNIATGMEGLVSRAAFVSLHEQRRTRKANWPSNLRTWASSGLKIGLAACALTKFLQPRLLAWEFRKERRVGLQRS
jgi:class 3 adenylate cyclase